MAAYHKVARPYLGVANPEIHALARRARKGVAAGELADMARGLWASNIHEARIGAASLLTLRRFRPDEAPVWNRCRALCLNLMHVLVADRGYRIYYRVDHEREAVVIAHFLGARQGLPT